MNEKYNNLIKQRDKAEKKIDESEQLLKIFANYVNKNKPDKNKKDSPNL